METAYLNNSVDEINETLNKIFSLSKGKFSIHSCEIEFNGIIVKALKRFDDEN